MKSAVERSPSPQMSFSKEEREKTEGDQDVLFFFFFFWNSRLSSAPTSRDVSTSLPAAAALLPDFLSPPSP